MSGQPASAGVAILRHGIEFDAIGGEVVHIVALLGRTEETSKRQMELLAALSRLLQTDNLRSNLPRGTQCRGRHSSLPERQKLIPDLRDFHEKLGC